MAGQTSWKAPEEEGEEMQRPDYHLVKFYDRKAGRYIPAAVVYPATLEPYAVVHAPFDAEAYDVWVTKDQHDDMMARRTEDWDAPDAVSDAIDKARHGGFDEEAERHGYSNPISYVLCLADAVEEITHHERKNSHVVGEADSDGQ